MIRAAAGRRWIRLRVTKSMRPRWPIAVPASSRTPASFDLLPSVVSRPRPPPRDDEGCAGHNGMSSILASDTCAAGRPSCLLPPCAGVTNAEHGPAGSARPTDRGEAGTPPISVEKHGLAGYVYVQPGDLACRVLYLFRACPADGRRRSVPAGVADTMKH
jgi:hypothetical protein